MLVAVVAGKISVGNPGVLSREREVADFGVVLDRAGDTLGKCRRRYVRKIKYNSKTKKKSTIVAIRIFHLRNTNVAIRIFHHEFLDHPIGVEVGVTVQFMLLVQQMPLQNRERVLLRLARMDLKGEIEGSAFV